MAADKMTLIICSVCLEEFKDPRALPCLHTFCLDCLVQLCGVNPNNGTVKCPMCKEQHRIPQNGAQGFRKDFRMKSFMEVNQTKELHIKPTMCKQHPHLELILYCEELNCSQALCIQCAMQSHQNHGIQPAKSIFEAQLSNLKVNGEAIEFNRQLVLSTKKKLEDHRSEMHKILKRNSDQIRAQLEKEVEKSANCIDKIISKAQDNLTAKENDIQEVQAQQKALETVFSGTILNIVEANADNHLGKCLGDLYGMLNSWCIQYTLLKVVDLDPFRNMNKKWVVEMPEQSIKGAPVALFGPVVVPATSEGVTTRKKTKPVACALQKPGIKPVKRPAIEEMSPLSDSSDSEEEYVTPTRKRKHKPNRFLNFY